MKRDPELSYKPCLLKLKKVAHKPTKMERAIGQKLYHYICEQGHKSYSTRSNAKTCMGAN